MKTPLLLGIMAVTIIGSFAVSGLFVQAGLEDLERIEVVGNTVDPSVNNVPVESIATCPNTHPILIGGSYGFRYLPASEFLYDIDPIFDVITNSYRVVVTQFSTDVQIEVTAKALCGKINFPMMGMVGGIPLDIDTVSLFIGAIGVNPVITGLVAITMGGVAAQAIWYVNSRRVKKVE